MRSSPMLAAMLAATIAASAALAAPPRETRIPDPAFATAAQLRERALQDRTSWQVVDSLTT